MHKKYDCLRQYSCILDRRFLTVYLLCADIIQAVTNLAIFLMMVSELFLILIKIFKIRL